MMFISGKRRVLKTIKANLWVICLLPLMLADACRWAIYAGREPEEASSLFTAPAHGLCEQSFLEPYRDSQTEAALYFDVEKFHARNHEFNLDGWGLGWYDETGNLNRHRSADAAAVPGETLDRNLCTFRLPAGHRLLRAVRGCWQHKKQLDVDSTTNGNIDVKGGTMTDSSYTADGKPRIEWKANPKLVRAISDVASNVLFGHVRATTSGDTNEVNSHPFKFKKLAWMHNGGISQKTLARLQQAAFNSCPQSEQSDLENHIGNAIAGQDDKLKPTNCQCLRPLIWGNTDSEYLAAFFIDSLDPKGHICERKEFALEELQRAMRRTVDLVAQMDREDSDIDEKVDEKHANQSGSGERTAAEHVVTEESLAAIAPTGSSLNLAVSDGNHVVVTRYRTTADEDPPSLYYARTQNGVWIGSEPLDAPMESGKWIASEPLDAQMAGGKWITVEPTEAKGFEKKDGLRKWDMLAKDEMLSYTIATDKIERTCLSESCRLDIEHRDKLKFYDFFMQGLAKEDENAAHQNSPSEADDDTQARSLAKPLAILHSFPPHPP